MKTNNPYETVFTRKCPDCGWTNGAYIPEAGMWVPAHNQPCDITDEDGGGHMCGDYPNFCLQCKTPDGKYKRGHMIWVDLSQ